MTLQALLDALAGCWWEHQGKPEENGQEIYLRCQVCGLRSSGAVHDSSRLQFIKPTPPAVRVTDTNVLPFQRSA